MDAGRDIKPANTPSEWVVPDYGRIAAEHIAHAQELAGDPKHQAELVEQERAEKQRLEAFKLARWRTVFHECVPARVRRKMDGDVESTAAVKAVRAWLYQGCQKDLVLRGPIGTGKSVAACAAVYSWTEPEVAIAETMPGVRSPIVTRQERASWFRPDALVSAVLHDYDASSPKIHRYVVIDDLGRETKADFQEAFCELLDRDDVTILATTNLTKTEMRERLDLRILDRLRERAFAVDIEGASMRKGSDTI